MLIETEKIITEKLISPNKLPFLQAQVLQKIYLNINNNIASTIEEFAEITDYKKDSKILSDAIKALNIKKFIDGDLENGFFVPDDRTNLYKSVVNKNDYVHKVYSDNILRFQYINKVNNSINNNASSDIQVDLFQTNTTNKNTISNNVISHYNKSGTCHRWYDYLEDFPYYLIEEKIKEYGLSENSIIVEPFAGSGTTNVSSKMFNMKSYGFDANPLMAFISSVKTTWDVHLENYKKEVISVAKNFLENIHNIENLAIDNDFLDRMPKKELSQWLSFGLQKEIILLKSFIKKGKDEKIKNLLLLAMSRAALDASFVAFCPGTTFYPFREKEEFWNIFTNRVIDIYKDLQKMQEFGIVYPDATLINDSCLNARKYIKDNSIDFLVTSPPYPNDLEYTRQTRLEMYMLDFVQNMEDVQKIKRNMVKGSTKLIYKESNSASYITHFESVMKISDEIFEQTKDKNWGFDYPRMVREYFGDMYLCMKEFLPLMKQNARFLLVVGDQTIKGVYIPVCDILIEMAYEMGYSDAFKELFRVRRSSGHNIELPEEIVILKK